MNRLIKKSKGIKWCSKERKFCNIPKWDIQKYLEKHGQSSKSEKMSQNKQNSSNMIASIIDMASNILEKHNASSTIPTKYTPIFSAGQTYDPFDFSYNKKQIEKARAIKKKSILKDPFAKTGINPTDMYLMPEVLSLFIFLAGKFYPRLMTGCNSKNQFKLVNCIKTSKSFALMSSVHRHSNDFHKRNM